MSNGEILAGLSPRAAFILSASLMAASFVLAVVSTLDHSSPFSDVSFAGLTFLLTLTTAYTWWSWKIETGTEDASEERAPKD